MKFVKALLTVTVLTALGCSNQMGIDQALQSAGASCQSDPESQGLKVVGSATNQSGSVAQYSLNKDGVCIPGENVHWKAAGATKTLTTSAGLNSVFQRAGTYVISGRERMSSEIQSPSLRTTVVSNEMKLAAPQLAFSFQDIAFSVVAPIGVTITSVKWDFGDGSGVIIGASNHSHMFYDSNEFLVKVEVTDSEGQVVNLEHRIRTIDYIDGDNCILDLSITGASEAKVKVATTMHVFIPDCLTDKIGAVRWDFGDGGSATNQSVTHAYEEKGDYKVTAVLYENGSANPFITLDHAIRVTEDLVIPPDPEEPQDPNACKAIGETREHTSELYTDRVTCGLNGTKVVTYKDHVTEQCSSEGKNAIWKEISRSQETTHEGQCEGQSCRLPNGDILVDGASKIFYSNSTPVGSCSSVSETRTCNNGILSGSASHTQLTCNNGCGDFGSHGTVKTGVTIGEVQSPLTCQFGEQGFFDTYHQLADKTCIDGSIKDSNIREGSLKLAGMCPTYDHSPTEKFTACSADCGGTQQRIYECRDDKGNLADAVRCASQAVPVEERLCDANPEAVRSQSVSTYTEEANSSNLCPKNQIGTIVKTREVTKTQVFACIDHKVQQESESLAPGAWVEESFCRDYVARRCSQDSLSNTEAKGRYDWMLKCQDQLPIIKDFLASFSNVKVTVGGKVVTLGGSGQELYPTFMNYATKPEKPWIAPKNKNAACTMPSTVYVATVCVSSCSTPEQQILVRDENTKKMVYSSFLENFLNNTAHVASLRNEKSLLDGKVTQTKVDQWVTELIDTEHDILVFKLKSGRELKVTRNHVLVHPNGHMEVAEKFSTKDSLVMLGGVLDPIVSITPMKYFGKVYNVFVNSNNPYHNIVITNGYLNGTAYFQNEGAKDLNRTLLRNKLTQGVFH